MCVSECVGWDEAITAPVIIFFGELTHPRNRAEEREREKEKVSLCKEKLEREKTVGLICLLFSFSRGLSAVVSDR